MRMQRALDLLSCQCKWNLIKERATLLNGWSKHDEVDILWDSGRIRSVWKARHPEKFITRDLRRWRRYKYLLIAPRATYRVRCKPTLQNRRTIHTGSHIPQSPSHRVASTQTSRQKTDPTLNLLAYSVYAELTIAAILSLVGWESVECFVNSWRSVERRAEGANREAGFRSGAAAPQDAVRYYNEIMIPRPRVFSVET